jgi:hypothetical protein
VILAIDKSFGNILKKSHAVVLPMIERNRFQGMKNLGDRLNPIVLQNMLPRTVSVSLEMCMHRFLSVGNEQDRSQDRKFGSSAVADP